MSNAAALFAGGSFPPTSTRAGRGSLITGAEGGPNIIGGQTLDHVFASVIEIGSDGTPGNGDPFDAGELTDNGGAVATIALKNMRTIRRSVAARQDTVARPLACLRDGDLRK